MSTSYGRGYELEIKREWLSKGYAGLTSSHQLAHEATPNSIAWPD